jgi:hypothetical protein
MHALVELDLALLRLLLVLLLWPITYWLYSQNVYETRSKRPTFLSLPFPH